MNGSHGRLPDGRPLPSGRGRSLPPSPQFAGDDGSTDPHLARALAQPDGAPRLRAVVRALGVARVLVPVVAHLDERADAVEVAGKVLAGEKQASAAMVTLATPDGRAAVPVFSGVDALRAWRADARPIPAEGVRAALSAVSDSDGLLVLDPGGPVTVLVPRPAVWAIAQQRDWVPAVEDVDVRATVSAALARIAGIAGSELRPGARAEVRVVLAVRPGLDRAGLDAVLQRASAALAAEELVAERIDSLELKVVASPQ